MGITAAPTAAGAIQTGVRNFSTGASYTYEAVLGAQVTGDGLPATVRNFTINNTNGVTLTNDVAVDSVLALTNGKLATGAGKVTVNATGNSLTGASSANYVNGTLERAVAAGVSTVAFPIGSATSYTPVSLAFGAGNTAGNVTANATVPGAPPAAGFAPTGSGIDQAQYIDRSWTLTSTISSPEYAATFTYINPGDVVGGANTGALIVAKNEWRHMVKSRCGIKCCSFCNHNRQPNLLQHFLSWRRWMCTSFDCISHSIPNRAVMFWTNNRFNS